VKFKNKKTEIMNLLKNWWTYTKKILCSLKRKTVITEPKDNQPLTKTAGQFSRFYDINDLPLKNFERCINGQYEYMTKDGVLQTESQLRFMEIYFKYIEQVGGGAEWAVVNREYADLKIQSLLLIFSKELIVNGMYDNSHCKKMMLEYFEPLPVGHELPMIDSHLATLQFSLDSVSKRIKAMNKSDNNNTTLVTLLAQICDANKVYLPYNSILLIEFIEQYKILKEQQKRIKNGRLNK
jgi:hypothetical protein